MCIIVLEMQASRLNACYGKMYYRERLKKEFRYDVSQQFGLLSENRESVRYCLMGNQEAPCYHAREGIIYNTTKCINLN